jgi:molecular chaperone GrpE
MPENHDESQPEATAPAAPPQTEGSAPGGRAEAASQSLEEQNRELHDRLLRTAADFDNFRKRARRDQDEAAARGREALLKEILPVIDNLERALQHAPEGDPVASGVRMVEKQLLGALERFGVTRFDPTGQPFDPNLHEAIQQIESSAHPPGAVAQVFARGFMQGPRLLRAAMVAVAKPPSTEAGPAAGGSAPPGDASGAES